MYYIFLSIHLLMDILGCLTVVNNAAVNLGVHVPFQIIVFSGYMSRSGVAGLCCNCIFSFIRNLHNVFHRGRTSLLSVTFYRYTKDTQLHLHIFSCDDFSVKLRTISTVQIFIISAYFLFSVCGRSSSPFRHLSLSEWHFSEGDNFQICWPLNSSYRPLVWSTEIVVIIKEDHLKLSGTKYLSVDQQKEIVFMMYFLMPLVGLISRSSLPLWEPLATYGYQALAVWQVKIEMHCRYYILGFKNLGSKNVKLLTNHFYVDYSLN